MGSAATKFKAVSGVYALVDPRTNRVLYCGQSLDIDYRYRQHLDPDAYTSNVNKRRWIAELRAAGLRPRLVILAKCEWPESDEVEKQFIRNYRLAGQCELNVATGGKRSRAVSRLNNTHQDDWFELGRRLNAARDLLIEAMDVAGKLAGPKAIAEVIEARQSLDKLKVRMEARLTKAFPEWTEFTQAFFGSESA